MATKNPSKKVNGVDMTSKKPRYHHGALAEALLEEAARVIEAEGAEAMTLRGCARALGVDAAALYRHFRDKEALLVAVAAREMLALGAQMDAAREAEYDAKARFLALGRAYVRFGLTRPQRYRLLFGGQCPGAALTAQLEALRGGSPAPDPYALLSSALDELRAAGELTAAPPSGAELMAWAAVHGLVSLWLAGRADATHAEADWMADALCRALLRGWA